MQPAFPFPSSDWRGRTACHMTGWPHGIQTSNMLNNSLISYAQAVRFLSRNLVLNSSDAPECLVTYSDSEPLLSSATSADMQHDADHRCESRFAECTNFESFCAQSHLQSTTCHTSVAGPIASVARKPNVSTNHKYAV